MCREARVFRRDQSPVFGVGFKHREGGGRETLENRSTIPRQLQGQLHRTRVMGDQQQTVELACHRLHMPQQRIGKIGRAHV